MTEKDKKVGIGIDLTVDLNAELGFVNRAINQLGDGCLLSNQDDDVVVRIENLLRSKARLEMMKRLVEQGLSVVDRHLQQLTKSVSNPESLKTGLKTMSDNIRNMKFEPVTKRD